MKEVMRMQGTDALLSDGRMGERDNDRLSLGENRFRVVCRQLHILGMRRKQ
jgi:hypothetical protein